MVKNFKLHVGDPEDDSGNYEMVGDPKVTIRLFTLPDGTLIGKLRLPEVVSNLVFGGPKRNRLFITATTSVYSILLNVNGAPYPFDRT